MNLKEYIENIPDFPKQGILFHDIGPILANPVAMASVIARLSFAADAVGAEKIMAFESRGFVFGAPLAHELGLPFVMLRKEGKLPGKTIKATYQSEYGDETTLEMQVDAVSPKERVLLIDDLLATGGTSKAGVLLIEKAGATVAGLAYVIELTSLVGRKVLGDYPIYSLVTYDK